MTIVQSIILGIIEGITEFLPISSTFHLIWSSQFLGLVQTDFIKLFEVCIQAGAIIAVVFLYWKEILTQKQLLIKLVLSFIPTAGVGFLLYEVIKGVFFERILFTTSVFVMVGIAFLIVEYLIAKGKIKIQNSIEHISYKQALFIGLFQSFAVVPGVSRAGAVLIGMLFLGYRRDESAKYSFMLSIPTILAASLFDLYKMRDLFVGKMNELSFLVVGAVIAFIAAIFSIKWLISYLQKNSLKVFGWYRILIGIILLFIALVA